MTAVPLVSATPFTSTVTVPSLARSSHSPDSVPPPSACALPVSLTATAALSVPIDGRASLAVRVTCASVLASDTSDQPPAPSSLAARTRTS